MARLVSDRASSPAATWPERCKAAALADLKREEASDAEGGLGGDLLADVWRIFYEKAVVELHTKALCAELNAMEEAPWSTAKRGQPIDGNYLHRHLRDFIPGEAEAIAPRKFYVGGVEARGYNEQHFKDAFSRYLGKPLPSDARKADVLKKARAGPMPPPGGSKRPSTPSHPSQKLKSEAASASYKATGAPSQGVAQPVATRPRRSARRPALTTGLTTGKDVAPVAKNSEPDEAVKGHYDGYDGQDGQFEGPPGRTYPCARRACRAAHADGERPRGGSNHDRSSGQGCPVPFAPQAKNKSCALSSVNTA